MLAKLKVAQNGFQHLGQFWRYSRRYRTSKKKKNNKTKRKTFVTRTLSFSLVDREDFYCLSYRTNYHGTYTNHRKVRLTNGKDINTTYELDTRMHQKKNHNLKTNQNLHSYVTDKNKRTWERKHTKNTKLNKIFVTLYFSIYVRGATLPPLCILGLKILELFCIIFL